MGDMNEGHYTEDQLAEFARSGGHEADEHLGTCAVCRSRFEFLDAFYRSYRQESKEPASDQLDRFIALHTVPNVIELKPYAPLPDVHAMGAGDHMLVLAAQDSITDELPIRTEATFANNDPNILVRAVRDEIRKNYTIHVLSEVQEIAGNVIVSIKEADGNVITLVTTKTGMAACEHPSPIAWKSSVVTIMKPSAVFPLENLGIGEGRLASEGFILEVTTDGKLWNFSLPKRFPEPITRAGIVKSDGKCTLKDVISGKFTLDVQEAEDAVELRLFS